MTHCAQAGTLSPRTEDIVERFYRNFFSYMAILSKKSINGIGTDDVLRCQDCYIFINRKYAYF